MTGITFAQRDEIEKWRRKYCEDRGSYLRSLQASWYTSEQIKKILNQEEERKEKI